MTTGQPSLLQAVDDPRLFGHAITLYTKQREIVSAVEGSHLQHIWALGRRAGKTHCAAVVLAHAACFRPDLDACMRRGGEVRWCASIAANKQQAQICLRVARDLIEGSPILAQYVLSSGDEQIVLRFPDGRQTGIAAYPCTSRGVRGRPISTLVLDEFAHFLDTEGNASDASIYQAAKPSLAQFGQLGRLILCSTPAGSGGKFADEFGRAVSGEEPTSLAWQLATDEVNVRIDADWLAAEERADPDMYASEYRARFVGGVGAFFNFARITVGRFREQPPEASDHWRMGIDPALQRDPFAAAVVGRDPHTPNRLIVGRVVTWQGDRAETPEEYAAAAGAIFDEVGELGREFSVRGVESDQHLSKIVSRALSERGLHVTIRGLDRATIFRLFSDVRARLYAGEMELPDDPDLIAELKQVRIKHAGSSSAIVLPHTARGHCDRAVALALAVHQLPARHGLSGARRRPARGPRPVTADLGDGSMGLLRAGDV
ncbi:MAG: terminase large subunit domain-containing protein [Solirubrobacteraceae bacterium]